MTKHNQMRFMQVENVGCKDSNSLFFFSSIYSIFSACLVALSRLSSVSPKLLTIAQMSARLPFPRTAIILTPRGTCARFAAQHIHFVLFVFIVNRSVRSVHSSVTDCHARWTHRRTDITTWKVALSSVSSNLNYYSMRLYGGCITSRVENRGRASDVPMAHVLLGSIV